MTLTPTTFTKFDIVVHKETLKTPYFSVELKNQVWLKTNLGYYATIKKLQSSNMLVGDLQSWKGRTHFFLKDAKDATFQITTKGKLGIYYPKEIGYEVFLEKIKPFLTKADDTQAKVTKIIRGTNNALKIEEADYEDVVDCIKAISRALRERNKNVWASRFDQLIQLSERKRVAHFPNVLKQIKECLESPILAQDYETFKKLVVTLTNILFNENYHKPQDWNGIVEKIQNEISPKVISLIKRNLEFPDFSIVTFLGICGRKEAIEAIFDKFKSNPVEALPRSDTGHALAKLYSKHKSFINQQLDELLKDKDKTLVELAKKRRREIMHQRSILDG